MPKGAKTAGDNRYIGTNFRIWQAAGEWKFKASGKHVLAIDVRYTQPAPALGTVSSALGASH